VSRRAFVLIAWLLVGCSSDEVPAAEPPADQARACRTLVSALPSRVDGDLDSGRSQYAAAWGDPQIVLKCGVAVPSGYEKTSEMIAVNGVAWFGEEQPEGYLFTAVGRTPLVEVYVPDSHQPEVNPLVDLAEPMQKYTEVSGPAGVVE